MPQDNTHARTQHKDLVPSKSGTIVHCHAFCSTCLLG
jgi:hypothetical protein